MNKTNLINFSLVIGTFLGITLALLSSINETNFDNSDRWVAKVGEVEISREKYLLQLDGLNLDKSMPLNQEDKDFVLERMIEEELLIQRAKDLGMFSSNTMIRGPIIQQMINLVISENSLEIISKTATSESGSAPITFALYSLSPFTLTNISSAPWMT